MRTLRLTSLPLPYVHVDPEAQALQPVNPKPPHWPYFGLSQPDIEPALVVVVTTATVDEVVLTPTEVVVFNVLAAGLVVATTVVFDTVVVEATATPFQ